MVSLFLLLGYNLSCIVDLVAALHELASASARTLLKLASSVRALLKPYGDTLRDAVAIEASFWERAWSLARAGKYDVTKPVGRVNEPRHNNKTFVWICEKKLWFTEWLWIVQNYLYISREYESPGSWEVTRNNYERLVLIIAFFDRL